MDSMIPYGELIFLKMGFVSFVSGGSLLPVPSLLLFLPWVFTTGILAHRNRALPER